MLGPGLNIVDMLCREPLPHSPVTWVCYQSPASKENGHRVVTGPSRAVSLEGGHRVVAEPGPVGDHPALLGQASDAYGHKAWGGANDMASASVGLMGKHGVRWEWGSW